MRDRARVRGEGRTVADVDLAEAARLDLFAHARRPRVWRRRNIIEEICTESRSSYLGRKIAHDLGAFELYTTLEALENFVVESCFSAEQS